MKIVEQPLVSVLMNCYNGESFLKEAIDSVYSQTYKNWEIIFWDNASTDQSAEIAKSYDSRLKYYRTNKTSLLGEARVLATEKAIGKYLAFLDSDDLWCENKLQKQIELLINNDDLGFVYCGTKVIYENSSKKEFIYNETEQLKDGDIFEELAKENFITFSSVVADKDKFIKCGGFPKHFKNSTDYWIFLRLAEMYPVGAVQDVLCIYRIHSNNLSSAQKVIGALESIEVVSSFLPNTKAVEGLRYQYVTLAIKYIKEMKIFSGVNVLLRKGGWILFFNRMAVKVIGKTSN